MEIILKEDIAGLGYKNDLVQVRPGYARNFLIPKGYAIVATESAKKIQAENVKQVAHKAEKLRKDAEELAANIGDITLEIAAKVGESGKIFGKVTTTQISDALRSKGFEVDRKKISLDSEVKSVGNYTATLDLHKEVKHKIKFNVIGD
ncbi:50S ribosomal protein L9 [Cytophagaceae bacterium DM2B3-1]|uniref:Large ribosomal subunit protein bL9 n=2 Tax=Xanthocytophaga TaxID=3078918 RepID=A0ABT7CJP9_9BACT|nr:MULTISPECIES: 50S ribosomal protein L9 [Xanthocytophaga]MDJ1467889.1 50S ribosomal protein L9 [Xanthocytophaga flavus]MDJ1493967.1 50S ribosomal protein L9 [Xanthocytophaga flavus]MDJ1501513.1 50S ribosomal protein L9 [Xanthocytophaga agilis]